MISTDKNEQELDIWIKKHFDNLKNLSIEYLKKFENIIDFESIYQPIPENILNQFIFNRIYGKKKENTYPGLYDEDVFFLQNSPDFFEYFKEFLSIKFKCDYFCYIENEILNKSRTYSEFGLGNPTLDKNVRMINSEYVKNLGNCADNSYKIIDKYFLHIEKNHDNISLTNYLLDIFE